MTVRLSEADVSRLAELSSVLLSPLDTDFIDEWRQKACQAFSTLIDSEHVFFLAAPLRDVEPMWSSGIAEPLRVGYSVRYADDEGTNRALRIGITLYNQTMIVAGDWDGYRRDPTVNELYLPHDVHDVIGLLTQVEADSPTGWCRFQLGATHERYGTERFGEMGLGMMRLIAPAFEAGIATLLAAGAFRASLAGALDALESAAWVYSATADRVVHRNASATHLVTDEPEASLVERAAAELAAELARSRKQSKSANGSLAGCHATRRVRTATARYALNASYIDSARLGPQPTILVLADRTSRQPLPRSSLQQQYNLTRRELEIAQLIHAGSATADMARRLGISIHTTRRHLEQLYRKLGVHSRAEAQRLLNDIR